MILDNGVIRTIDPSLPTAGCARDRRRARRRRRRHARVGAADTRACRPRWPLCRCPRSPTAMSISPPGRSRGATSTSTARLARGGARPRRGSPTPRTWIRGTGWRDADVARGAATAAALDAVTGTTPAALWAKDYHSLWLNSAGLASRAAISTCRAASSSGTRTGADRDPARGVGMALPRRCVTVTRGRVGRRDPRGDPDRELAAASPRFTTRTAGSAPPRSSVASTRATG